MQLTILQCPQQQQQQQQQKKKMLAEQYEHTLLHCARIKRYIPISPKIFSRQNVQNEIKDKHCISAQDGGVAQRTSHPPQEQKTRVRIPPG
jgi:hypothetical protein